MLSIILSTTLLVGMLSLTYFAAWAFYEQANATRESIGKLPITPHSVFNELKNMVVGVKSKIHLPKFRTSVDSEAEVVI